MTTFAPFRLKPVMPVGLVPTREQIIQEAKRQRLKIHQLLDDVDHWNETVRAEGEDPIVIDGDGMLARMAANLTAMLDKEFADIRFFWVTEKSEIYAARSFEELRKWLEESGSLYEDLTVENEGEEWGELKPEEINGRMIQEEEGEIVNYHEAVKRGPFPPCQIATGYQ